MAGSGPTTSLAAATAFSQVSVTGIGDPESSVPAEAGALLSHTTFGAAAVLGDGDGGLLDGGAGDAGVLAEGGAETDGAGVAHPAATARSTATAPLARKRAPVCPFMDFPFRSRHHEASLLRASRQGRARAPQCSAMRRPPPVSQRETR